MADPLKRFRPGERFIPSARSLNAWSDVADAYQRGALGVGGGGTGFAGFGSDTVLVKNTTGGDVSRFSVLAVSGVVVSPSDDLDAFRFLGPVLSGATPASSDVGNFVITSDAISDGGIGPAVIAGLVACQVNVLDAAHDFADSGAADTAKLVSAPSGSARILYKESGTGTKWALLRIGNGATIANGITTVIYDVQWDTTAGKLQKKTIDLSNGTISSWIDIETAEDCT